MKPAMQNVVPFQIRKRLLALAFAIGMSAMSGNALCDSGTMLPKYLLKPYTERQTYKEGQQAFEKDNNVWVYSPAFAKTFGMPPENIYSDLKGIEAAAYRIEDPGYKLCGMGGKEENCMTPYRCVTDVYIDESKYPLPWATDQLADWHPRYSSVQWLRGAGESGVISKMPKNMKPFSGMNSTGLHSFMDAETNIKVYIGHNGDAPKNYKDHFSGVQIFGYKRNTIAGLTMISLDYGCMSRNSEHTDITFGFQSAISDKIGRTTLLKKFHEFILPDVFERKIDVRLREKQERDKVYYLQLLNQPNQK